MVVLGVGDTACIAGVVDILRWLDGVQDLLAGGHL
jgi:hypothetical protein